MPNNNYSLITGASEGLGKALAIECAARKMNLILVVRTGPALINLANFIKGAYEVDVITIEKDLYKEENCISLFDEVSALNININMLINNAGTGSTLLFTEGSFLHFQKQIQLNILATTLITRLFIAKLQQNSPGHILNVGSLSCFFSLTKKQVYGATKSYIYYFSKSLRRELKQVGINVSVVCPGCINTNPGAVLINQSVNWLARLSVMNPEDVASIAIENLLKRKEVIIPGRLNKFFLFLNTLLPSFISKRITDRQMKRLDIATTGRNHLFDAGSSPQNKIAAG
jgi:short-subunit dehydrogenase